MSRTVRLVASLVLGLAPGLSTGCGSGGGLMATDSREEARQGMLKDVGELFRVRSLDKPTPPSSASDFARYEAAWPNGMKRVKDGGVVVVWGASLQDGASDKVLAFEKGVPESGGYVLMQDGTTVRNMSADQFQAAPKAAGK